MIVWDEPKRITTLEKHGLDFASLDETFFLNARIIPAKANRYFAIGRLADNSVVVVFAYLGTEGLSVITMRRANAKERRLVE
ncbi:conserved hypothetical protein [Mesorhizobium metallidurans STM 2683]|uniref:BrnT family toxin n=2 Tax=Mesorhizobium metallidurans TaxID=489722 RepID=M5EX96_9HYPH|nr:conserved hypothetical protein [Mesorhizobium metallidurans STM 2683]